MATRAAWWLGARSEKMVRRTRLTRRAERFARQLNGRFRLPVELVDERYSSAESRAACEPRTANAKTADLARGKTLDSHAAQIILEQYFGEKNDVSKLPDAEALIPKLTAEHKSRVTPATAMIGLHTGGRLARRAAAPAARIEGSARAHGHRVLPGRLCEEGLKHDPKRTKIPYEVEGRDLLLVDDVLYTGRTVRGR